MKLLKKYFWFFIILLQAFIGICAGFIMMASQSADHLSGSYSGKLHTKTSLKDYLDDQLKTGSLAVEIDGKLVSIPYSEFEVSVDIDKTFDNLQAALPDNGIEQFFSSETADAHLKPVFTYNSGKLRKSLEEIFSAYEKQPVAESYGISHASLLHVPPVSGIKADYELLEKELSVKIFAQSNEPYRIDSKASPVFVEMKGGSVYPEPFVTLVSNAEVQLEIGYENKAKVTLESLQGIVIKDTEEVSLKKLLDFSVFSNDVDKDILNRIATALFQSAIKLDGIKTLNRKPASRPVSFTEPGLEAIIEGEDADLLMRNETGKPLMLLFEITPNALSFYVASTGEIKSGMLIVQKKDPVPPPVITSVNKTLSVNDIKVVSDGVPGFTAYVSRVVDNNQTELHHDKYQPISKIVETGEKPINSSIK